MWHWFSKTLISNDTADWMALCGQWIIQEFDDQAFWQKTPLVLPDKTFFPTPVDSPQQMAQYVFKRVTELAGIGHWPWRLVDAVGFQSQTPAFLPLDTAHRFVDFAPIHPQLHNAYLDVPVVWDQLAKPQDLVASLSHLCAQHWLWQSQKSPPGGMAHFEQAAEMLAIFWGFGVMLTNSAYTYRGSCASCYNPRANRQASLTESETLYALAMFAWIKNIPQATVFNYLKPYLRSDYKVALKQVQGGSQLLALPGGDRSLKLFGPASHSPR